MSHRISPTLLDSFAYYRSEYGATEEKRREILDRLRGVSAPPNEAMQFGANFEQAICDHLEGVRTIPVSASDPYDAAVLEAASIVSGAWRQVHVEYPLTGLITLHGYIDFLTPACVVDTKTTKSYEIGKYLGNMQHRVYLAGLRELGIERFAYVVYDRTQKRIAIEEYFWREAIVDELRGAVNNFLGYLEIDPEMKQAFYEKGERERRGADEQGV